MDVPTEFAEPLVRLSDGTIKQVNPFTGTQVWTVPGRAHRPLTQAPQERAAIESGRLDYCSFCPERYLETTPERERVVLTDGEFVRRVAVSAASVSETTAEFRCISNLFEIVSWDYWVANHGCVPSDWALAHYLAYRRNEAGREHLLALMRTRDQAAGQSERDEASALDDSLRFFAGYHDVVISRRHYVDGAQYADQLAGSGDLTCAEHEQYIAMTIRAMQRLYATNPHALLVQAFQNWLRPAGASFDHLHKQLVAVDELGTDLHAQLQRATTVPDLYARFGPSYAERQGLVIARNQHAVAVAGIGHRFPAVEVWSLHPGRPWELCDEAVRGWSDLLRAIHAATGSNVPCNEEWHHQPPSVELASPMRAVIKWRINTPAGFEGGTRIYVNTIDPWTITQRIRRRIDAMSKAGFDFGDLTLAVG